MVDAFDILERLLSERGQTQEAWHDFLDQYSKLILKIIWLREHDYDEAMEKYLYICKKLCENDFAILGKFQKNYRDNPPKFTSWLSAVVRNLAIDAHRKKHGRKRYPKLLQEMSEMDRKFFMLYYWKGYSLEEIDRQFSASEPDENRSALEIHQDIKARYLNSNQNPPHKDQPVSFQRYLDELNYSTAQSNGMPSGELADFFRYWLQKLPAKKRLVLKLRFWENLKPLEIAEILNIEPPNKVYRILKKGLAELREFYLKKLV